MGDNRIGITRGGGASSLWWAAKNEWLGLLDIAGLGREAPAAVSPVNPFAGDSREYVFAAHRRLRSKSSPTARDR